MLTRVKTFDATGNPPNGKLYAGDLNAIQDAVAAASDLAQTIGAASYQIGESGLMIVRFGAGEARLTGALRTDGRVRAGGGLDVGMTTTQRDALPAGFRPPGTLIYNTTTGRPEANVGTDAAPNWQPQYIEVPIGSVIDWPWASGGIPSWALLCYGQAIPRGTVGPPATNYYNLHQLAAAASYPHGAGDGSTTFTMPDYRGRVGAGKDDMGGTAANRITVAVSGFNGVTLGGTGGVEGISLVTGQLPAHNHTASEDSQGAHTHTFNVDAAGSHSHGGGTGYTQPGTGTESADHSHTVSGNFLHHLGGYLTYQSGPQYSLPTPDVVNPGTGGRSAAHTHTVDNHQHSISADGSHGHSISSFSNPGGHQHTITIADTGSGPHNGPAATPVRIVQPSIVVNKMMRAL